MIDKVARHCEHDNPAAIATVADKLGPGMEDLAALHADLVYDILAPGYAGSYSWLLRLNPDDSWRVAFGQDGSFFGGVDDEKPEDFGAAIFIPVSGTIQRLWKLKTPEMHRREREAEFIQKRLSAAGIEARVRFGETDADVFISHAPDADTSAIEQVLGQGFTSAAMTSGEAS